MVLIYYDSFSDKALNTANITNSDTITTKNLNFKILKTPYSKTITH